MRVRKRLRRIKRLAYLGGIVGVVVAVRQAKGTRDAHTDLGPPATWPPLEVGEPPVAAVGDLVTAAESTEAHPGGDVSPPATVAGPLASDDPVAAVGEVAADDALVWVAPEDGSCPLTHPVKANGNSGIYHVPGGPFYQRTRAERCYRDAAAAEADGYRAAKSS